MQKISYSESERAIYKQGEERGGAGAEAEAVPSSAQPSVAGPHHTELVANSNSALITQAPLRARIFESKEDDGGRRDRRPGRQPPGAGGQGPAGGAPQRARHARRRRRPHQRRVPRRPLRTRRQPQRLPRRQAPVRN